MQSTLTVAWLALLLLGFVNPAPMQSPQALDTIQTPTFPFIADINPKPIPGGG